MHLPLKKRDKDQLKHSAVAPYQRCKSTTLQSRSTAHICLSRTQAVVHSQIRRQISNLLHELMSPHVLDPDLAIGAKLAARSHCAGTAALSATLRQSIDSARLSRGVGTALSLCKGRRFFRLFNGYLVELICAKRESNNENVYYILRIILRSAHHTNRLNSKILRPLTKTPIYHFSNHSKIYQFMRK